MKCAVNDWFNAHFHKSGFGCGDGNLFRLTGRRKWPLNVSCPLDRTLGHKVQISSFRHLITGSCNTKQCFH